VPLGSSFEPDDPAHYLHQPGGADRLFHYEMRLALLYDPWDVKPGEESSEAKQKESLAKLREKWRPVLAYMRWRLMKYLQEHPDVPLPDEVILLGHYYPTPAPEEKPFRRPAAVEWPLFRWRPTAASQPGTAPIEAFDPLMKKFVPLQDGQHE
jgi:hypothetical protein